MRTISNVFRKALSSTTSLANETEGLTFPSHSDPSKPQRLTIREFTLPALIFLMTSVSTLSLNHILNMNEEVVVQNLVAEQAEKIRSLIDTDTSGKLLALKRMGQRWEAANGTPEPLWRNDAANYIGQMSGLRALEWVDASHRLQWLEVQTGHEALTISETELTRHHKQALLVAAKQDSVIITPPFDLKEGYKGFIVYSPIRKK